MTTNLYFGSMRSIGAMLATGGATCRGANTANQLGLGPRVAESRTPVDVPSFS